MKTKDIVSRLMLARSEARYCMDCYVRTGDGVYLSIARIEMQLARALHRELRLRYPGIKPLKDNRP